MPKGEPDEYTMAFGDHLEELRRRIIFALVGVGVIIVLVLVFLGTDLIAWLQEPLSRVQRRAGLEAHTVALAPGTGFFIYMKVSFVAGLVLASPWVLYHAWVFVSEGLYSHERKAVGVLAPFSTLMMLLGVGFTYYIMLPLCLTFLIGFSLEYPAPGGREPSFVDRLTNAVHLFTTDKPPVDLDDKPEPELRDPDADGMRVPVFQTDPEAPAEGEMWINGKLRELRIFSRGQVYTIRKSTTTLLTPMIDINQYISFVLFMALGVCVGFQIPVAMFIASSVGILNPAWLKRYRAHAVIFMFLVSAVLTPQDPISMCVLALPLWLLFEFGLIIGRIAYRKARPLIP